ncbi:HNH endonuclease [Nocardia pseudobrasiliensis]|uniref:Putative restriction endonuclease n=1 Tax=Nocardia pseudobrasiliensis TaxID=45979 RepID=A0A370IF56_9NOCA|nr:HNH endonuclease [Nocardia pseudobrasiliensis]RDI69355.1 putative restriction endonuclease [Nocardia pseudobrasiliensis]
MDSNDPEMILRTAIFKHLDKLVQETGGVVTRDQLWDFTIDGETHRLVDRSRGIRNPSNLKATLSILSDPNGRYSDEEVEGNLFAYAYREGSTQGDNAKLRRAYELRAPLILLRKLRAGHYTPIFPAYVVADDPEQRRFLIGLDEDLYSLHDPLELEPIERKYVSRMTRQRLHQPEFRARVLLAYRFRCAVCEIGHGVLLEGAHIIADRREHGIPRVDNGLCLCKIHHAAFDCNYLGITPDYEVRIKDSLLQEEDGPMLQYVLQDMHGRRLSVPQRVAEQPSREFLAERFAEFSSAG